MRQKDVAVIGSVAERTVVVGGDQKRQTSITLPAHFVRSVGIVRGDLAKMTLTEEGIKVEIVAKNGIAKKPQR